ncbi:hypothetical protein AC623_11170 [Bacillus sp. FJAT-27231]|uniref:hypothetical protein n=1 Tax=Bacillus sp. FJAT-27231 TaxID=1679168 RepID=UPI0006708F78|nr:hypothetical protein [Bacillus sp. FJAT-27231]KMY54422.1 hypothetical protein AC623_11170 [Bacillus sp. FJAT-27231]
MIFPVTRVDEDVVQGEEKCLICRTKIDYVAVVKGDCSTETYRKIYLGKEVTDQVIVLESVTVSGGRNRAANVEVNVKCPKCKATNKFKNIYKF